MPSIFVLIVEDEQQPEKVRAEAYASIGTPAVAVTEWCESAFEAEAQMRRMLIKQFPELPKEITARKDFPN